MGSHMSHGGLTANKGSHRMPMVDLLPNTVHKGSHGMPACPMVDLLHTWNPMGCHGGLSHLTAHCGTHGIPWDVYMSRLCRTVPLSIPSHSPHGIPWDVYTHGGLSHYCGTHGIPCVPWDYGTGWTEGLHGMVWTCRHPVGSHGTMGRDGQRDCTAWSGHPDIPWDPMCTMGLWDGMDRGTAQHGLDMQTSCGIPCVPWDYGMGWTEGLHGMVWTCRHPVGSHGTMGRDGQRDCTVWSGHHGIPCVPQ